MSEDPTVVTAISFDAGNTLLHADPPPAAIYARVLSELGPEVGPEEVRPAFVEVWNELQLETPPGSDRYATVPGGERAWWGMFVRRVLERLHHPAPWREALDRLYAAFARPELWSVYPEVPAVLDQLRERCFVLAITSNWDSRLPAILDGLGLTRFFDAVTVSTLEGTEKPGREIFLRTARKLGRPPGEILHVGDSPRDDYRGAREAGLVPLLVDRSGLFSGNGYRSVPDLTPLPSMLSTV
jgi:putative hydrolase of the HAD superfamily